MYLLDTDVIIDYLRKERLIEEKLLVGSAISYFTLTELVFGALRAQNSNKQLTLVENFINDFKLHIVELDKETVYKFCQIKIRLEKQGEKLEDFDLFIAATAVVNNLNLITNNIKHYARIKELNIYKS